VTARAGRSSVVLVIALVATCALVRSSDAATPSAVAGSDPRAQALLQRAVAAESATAYAGVEYVSLTDASSSGAGGAGDTDDTDVLHVTHLPGRGTVLVEDADNGTPDRSGFAGTDADGARPNLLLGLLSRSYQLVLGPDAVIAGRRTTAVVARRADGTVAARFWIDNASGLLLRRDVVTSRGQLVRSVGFVQLALTAASPEHLPVMVPALTGRPLDDSDLDAWRARGWPCPRVLAGLSLFDARTEPEAGAGALHLSYSDGLSTVSVFAQPGRLDPAVLSETAPATVGGEQVRVRGGEPRQILWSSDGYVITVVADAPDETVAALVAALPHRSADTSAWSRVERGVSRVVSWLNPFS
jgi:sigma-E factor negative regulatory protein RseB